MTAPRHCRPARRCRQSADDSDLVDPAAVSAMRRRDGMARVAAPARVRDRLRGHGAGLAVAVGDARRGGPAHARTGSTLSAARRGGAAGCGCDPAAGRRFHGVATRLRIRSQTLRSHRVRRRAVSHRARAADRRQRCRSTCRAARHDRSGADARCAARGRRARCRHRRRTDRAQHARQHARRGAAAAGARGAHGPAGDLGVPHAARDGERRRARDARDGRILRQRSRNGRDQGRARRMAARTCPAAQRARLQGIPRPAACRAEQRRRQQQK